MRFAKGITLLAFFFSLLSFASCSTKNPYQGMREVRYKNQQIYVFNDHQKKLLIYIDGSGLNSVLGIRKHFKWQNVQFAYFLANNLDKEVTLIVPEKLNFKKGIDYRTQNDAIRKYTVENLVDSYSESIDQFLDHNQFTEIYLLGTSEGGLLAPRILNKINNKERIVKMVIWGAGGYSQRECFKILATSSIPMPQSYQNECRKIDEISKEIDAVPTSIDKYYLGWPFSRWYSFFNYSPITEYSKIDIPVSFIQGLKDYNSPVESVKYIETAKINDKYVFNYYNDMGHIPDNADELQEIIKSIYAWLKE